LEVVAVMNVEFGTEDNSTTRQIGDLVDPARAHDAVSFLGRHGLTSTTGGTGAYGF